MHKVEEEDLPSIYVLSFVFDIVFLLLYFVIER